MKHLKIRTVAMVFIAMLFCVNTFAQEGNNKGMQSRFTFADFDSNNDGVITKTEFTKAREKRENQRNINAGKSKTKREVITFESIDVNNDGKITKSEFANHQTKRRNNRGK